MDAGENRRKPLTYYPVNLNIHGRPCLVVGGGAVGVRKVAGLRDGGARVTVVAQTAAPVLLEMAQRRAIALHQRPFRTSDLDGMFLVIGATDDAALNRTISREAERRNILCNIVDVPQCCNFILPAVIRRGDLLIAVSTSGKSPAFAKHLRRQMQARFGEEYATFLDLMGAIRDRLLRREHAPEVHKPLFERLINGGLLEMIRRDQREAIDQLLGEVLGDGFRYDDLIPGNDGK
jgi:precorrin-2 dehydrogenase/sirohydrochlorin ferrochelatase